MHDGYHPPRAASGARAGYRAFAGLLPGVQCPDARVQGAAAGQHTPAPWVAVHGNFNSYQSRVELSITDTGALDGFSPSQTAWLVAALLRLRAESPVRVAVVANMPLASLPNMNDPWALAFEASGYQTGIFRSQYTELTAADIAWLSNALPIAAHFYHDERFMRSFTIFDESLWSGRTEVGAVLIWTAMEILFDLSGEQHKTKAICSALSGHVAIDEQDRDRAYNVIGSCMKSGVAWCTAVGRLRTMTMRSPSRSRVPLS